MSVADIMNHRIKPRKFFLDELKATINRTLDDCSTEYIPCGTIAGADARDWQEIQNALEIWGKEGILRILNDPETSEPSVPCVKMIKFIHRRSSRPGFLNFDE